MVAVEYYIQMQTRLYVLTCFIYSTYTKRKGLICILPVYSICSTRIKPSSITIFLNQTSYSTGFKCNSLTLCSFSRKDVYYRKQMVTLHYFPKLHYRDFFFFFTYSVDCNQLHGALQVSRKKKRKTSSHID